MSLLLLITVSFGAASTKPEPGAYIEQIRRPACKSTHALAPLKATMRSQPTAPGSVRPEEEPAQPTEHLGTTVMR